MQEPPLSVMRYGVSEIEVADDGSQGGHGDFQLEFGWRREVRRGRVIDMVNLRIASGFSELCSSFFISCSTPLALNMPDPSDQLPHNIHHFFAYLLALR